MVSTTNQIIKIFLVDDNRFFLEGLAYIIATNQQLQVVGTANTGKEALKKIDQSNPNVVVTDLVLPDINGIRLAKEILNKKNDVRVIVLSIYKDPEFIKAAKKSVSSPTFIKMNRLTSLIEPSSKLIFLFHLNRQKRCDSNVPQKTEPIGAIYREIYRYKQES